MLGTLLITSIPFAHVTASTNIENTGTLQNQTINTYIVKAGDTLYKIANRYGTTVSHLKSINGLSGDLIYVGQQLRINEDNYIVKAGDTLYKISSRYNLTVAQLKSANGLTGTGDMIYIGQTLIIPNRYINAPIIVSNPSNLLVLVNKKNSLPSDYIPKNLVVPNIPFSFKEYSDKKLMRQDAASALEEMFAESKKDNINLYAVSGYRSYTRQQTIFNLNVSKYGEERANQFSAKPGQSEHQTGLAIDVTSPAVNYILTQSFEDTKEGKWVKANAYRFGFILRYQKGKESITGYQYEPWHFRFVGKEAARNIVNQNITLEEYLGNI